MKRVVFLVTVTNAEDAAHVITKELESRKVQLVEGLSMFMTGHPVGSIASPNGQPQIETRMNFLIIAAVPNAPGLPPYSA